MIPEFLFSLLFFILSTAASETENPTVLDFGLLQTTSGSTGTVLHQSIPVTGYIFDANGNPVFLEDYQARVIGGGGDVWIIKANPIISYITPSPYQNVWNMKLLTFDADENQFIKQNTFLYPETAVRTQSQDTPKSPALSFKEQQNADKLAKIQQEKEDFEKRLQSQYGIESTHSPLDEFNDAQKITGTDLQLELPPEIEKGISTLNQQEGKKSISFVGGRLAVMDQAYFFTVFVEDSKLGKLYNHEVKVSFFENEDDDSTASFVSSGTTDVSGSYRSFWKPQPHLDRINNDYTVLIESGELSKTTKVFVEGYYPDSGNSTSRTTTG